MNERACPLLYSRGLPLATSVRWSSLGRWVWDKAAFSPVWRHRAIEAGGGGLQKAGGEDTGRDSREQSGDQLFLPSLPVPTPVCPGTKPLPPPSNHFFTDCHDSSSSPLPSGCLSALSPFTILQWLLTVYHLNSKLLTPEREAVNTQASATLHPPYPVHFYLGDFVLSPLLGMDPLPPQESLLYYRKPCSPSPLGFLAPSG